MNNAQIYRPAAIQSRHIGSFGNIVLIYPLPFRILTAVVVVFMAALIAFLAFGTYTARTTVTGQLVPDHGLIKVYASQSGVVLEKHVVEGQTVNKGDVLYVLSGERVSVQGETQSNISDQIRARLNLLHEEMEKTRHLQTDETDAARKRLVALSQEAQKLDSQISTLESRVHLAEETAARYRSLVQQKFISKDGALQKETDLLDQKQRLEVVQRDRLGVASDIQSLQSELDNLPLKHQNQLSEIERNIASTKQEYAESEAKRSQIIMASESGTATMALAEVGQNVDTGHLLISIVPLHSQLHAQLFVPSKAIGFVDIGTPVVMRYQAFPYQKFGHAKGVVVSISRTSLPASEIPNPANGAREEANQPLYRVTVDLPEQFISVYGKPKPLQTGMLLDADILQETRRLYEWTLDPAYGLHGKL